MPRFFVGGCGLPGCLGLIVLLIVGWLVVRVVLPVVIVVAIVAIIARALGVWR